MSERPPSSSIEPDPSGIERRASTRYPCNLATSCRLVASLPGEPVPARVRNISVGGVSLVLSHPFEADSLVSIELRSMARGLVRGVQVRIIYSIEHPSGDWILGASFVDALGVEELKSFLS
jgi:hypothetical protein